MNWKCWYGYGNSEQDKADSTGLRLESCFFLLLVLIPIGLAACYLLFIAPSPPTAVQTAVCVICLLMISYWPVHTVVYNNWLRQQFRLGPDGIQIKTVFGKVRTIDWSSVQAADIYNVFKGRNRFGEPFIVVFLNLEKRPFELFLDRYCFRRRKYHILIRATEENIEEFDRYWKKPLEKGQQSGAAYAVNGKYYW